MPSLGSFKSTSPLDTPSNSPLLKDFLLYLASERGLADNSIHAYRRDLQDIEVFFISRGSTLTSREVDDYREYLQNQSRIGQSTRTVARRLAAIRVFLRYRRE